MDKKLLKEEYKRLLTKAIEGRPGGMALMIVLEETDFYNSPASAKHHLNVPGGLVLHSLNVARTALELCENMPQFARCDKNAVLTAALLHDVCKAGNYIQKPDGSYQYRDTDLLGHGEASVINIQHWIHLTDKEVLAIRWHMGAYSGEQDWGTLSQISLVVPLHQLLISANGGAAGSQTQHTVGLHDDLRRNDVCCLAGHIGVVLCTNDLHDKRPLFFIYSLWAVHSGTRPHLIQVYHICRRKATKRHNFSGFPFLLEKVP